MHMCFFWQGMGSVPGALGGLNLGGLDFSSMLSNPALMNMVIFLAYLLFSNYLHFVDVHTVTKNVENLEYSGISMNMENSGNSVKSQGQFLTYKIVSVRSNICVTQQGLRLQVNKSLVNVGDGHSALVTCYIAGVDVESPFISKLSIFEKVWESSLCLCHALQKHLQAAYVDLM